MKKFRNISLTVILCVFLACVLVSQATLPAFAQEEHVYISEIQISTGKTASEAKQWLIDNGYTVLDEDLNAGTGKDYAYIGYKTTTNRDLAICDISMMSMRGGYKTLNYGALIQQVKDSSLDVIEGVLAVLGDFRTNYEAGSPNARIAKETLDLLLYDTGSDQTLGDYLLSPDRTLDDVTNLLFMCNSLVASLIYNQLALGVSDYTEDGTTWLDRASEAEPFPEELSAYELDLLDELYYKKAAKLEKAIDDYVRDLDAAYARLDRDDDGNVDEAVREEIRATKAQADEYLEQLASGVEIDPTVNSDALLIAVYDYLDEYDLGDYTIAELFDEVYYTDDLRLLYPLVASCLTEGQIAAMQLCGVVNMTIGTVNTEENYEVAHAELVIQGEELIASNNGVKPSAFIGVNKDVYQTEVGLTTEAERAAASSGNYAQLTEEDPLRADLKTALMACGMVALASIGVSIIALSLSVGGVIAGFGVFAMITAVATSAMASIGSFAAAVGLLGPMALGVVAAIAVIVILVVMLVDWIKDAYNDKHPEYTIIPETMFDYDVMTSQYIRYTAVKERGGDPGDLNCFQGREWNALYVSYDPTAGSPITANSMGEFFRVKRGNSEVANTYVALSSFGENTPANLNLNTYKDKVGGLYLFYTTEDSLAGITSEEQSGRYLSSLVIVQAKTPEEASLAIKKMSGYEVLEFNLTPNQYQKYTYIGYRTTTNPANAITDIRVQIGTPQQGENSSDMTGANITYGNGGAAYACAGCVSYEYATGTKEAIMLYYTKQSTCGDPIMADFYTTRSFTDVPEGYEPVNYFSGGPAFNFASRNGVAVGDTSANSHSYVYFRYEVPYSDDAYYDEKEHEGKTYYGDKQYLGGLVVLEMFKDDQNKVSLERMAADLGWKIINVDLKNVDSSYQNYGGVRLAYTTTNNPKRAIYDIRTYLYEPHAETVLNNITFNGAGYVVLNGYEKKIGEYAPKVDLNLMIDQDSTDNHNRFPVGSKKGKFETVLYSGFGDNQGYQTVTIAPRAMGIYVCGPMIDTESNMTEPINMHEFYVGSKGGAPAGLSAVVDFTDHYGQNPADISAARGVYIYYKETYPVKKKYIKSIEVVYSDAENFAHDAAKISLLAGNGDEILDYNLASVSGSIMFEHVMSGWGYFENYQDKAAFIRVTRTDKKAEAIRDIRIYEVGASDPEPAKKIKIDGYEYTRVSNKVEGTKIAYLTTFSGTSVKRVETTPYIFYVYTGGNGVYMTDIVIDNRPIANGYFAYTALNQNSKTNAKNPWWLHMKSSDFADMIYMSKVGVFTGSRVDDEGARRVYCDQFYDSFNTLECNILNAGYHFTLAANFNDRSADVDPVLVAFSMTKNPKDAITNVITSEQLASTINVNGIQYTLGTGVSFNADLPIGNNIYLYYTKDKSAGAPVLFMDRISQIMTDKFDYVQRAEGGISNVNLNAAVKEPDCDGDYTWGAEYLFLIREGSTENVNLYKKNNWGYTASVFSEDPKLVAVVVIAAVAVVTATGAVIIKNGKKKKRKTEDN